MRNWKKATYNNTEQMLKRAICNWIKLQGHVVYMYQAMRGGRQADGSFKQYSSPFMPPGVPDLLVCWGGRFVGIEVKRPDDPQRTLLGKPPARRGKLSDHQKRELERIRRSGGISIVAYSLDDVIRVLKPSQAINVQISSALDPGSDPMPSGGQ